jgi:hypothetical protein
MGVDASIVVIIAVVLINIPVVRVIIPKGISQKSMSLAREMISVPRKVHSLVFCEAMSGKPSEMASATNEMAAASTMATASSTMCERGGGHERENACQNQTDK